MVFLPEMLKMLISLLVIEDRKNRQNKGQGKAEGLAFDGDEEEVREGVRWSPQQAFSSFFRIRESQERAQNPRF